MKTIIFFFAILVTPLCYQAISKSYPFDVKKSGGGTQAVILIPGFGCSGEVWDETRAQLDKKFTCYTMTMAGFAGVPAQQQASMEYWKESIARYINDNKIDKPILIGHSTGGVLAMSIAADYPALIRKLVVVDALPCLAALNNPSFKHNPSNDCTPWATQMAATSDEQFVQMQRAGIPSLVSDTSRYNLILGWTTKSDKKTFGQMYCDFLNTDLREKIKSVQCPSLILLEAAFRPMASAMEAQYKEMKTATLKYASKGLHFVMFDDPAWFSQELEQFVK